MYEYTPTLTPRWRPLARGIYATSCLTQTSFLSPTLLVTAGTDGHAVFWPLPTVSVPSSSSSPQVQESAALRWQTRLRVHQNNAQSMAVHASSRGVLIVSGGDDGALAFVLVRERGSPDEILKRETAEEETEAETEADGEESGVSVERVESVVSPPVLLPRAHGSAVTACAIFTRGFPSARENRGQGEDMFVLTAGNDEWVRLWRVSINAPSVSSSSPSSSNREVVEDEDETEDGVEDEGRDDAVSVQRLCRLKTSVADVSSMAVLSSDGEGARVLVCGVGIEVLRVEYQSV
jgi:hypothetical protein